MAQPTANAITNLTRCLRLPGFFPGGYVDQFIRVLPFEEIGGYGRAVQINRTTSLGGVSFQLPGAALTATQGDTALETFDFQRLGGIAQVDVSDIEASDPSNNQLELQVEMRRVAVIRQLGVAVFAGSGVPPNIAGLNNYLVVDQVVDVAGAAPTLANYHRLVSIVRASDGFVGGGADALVMNANARRQLISILEAAGSASYCFAPCETLGVPVLKFEGIPVYVTDAIPSPANITTIYAAKLKGPTGIRVLHVGGRSEEFGIVVDDVPNQMGVSERAKIVRGYYALLVPEAQSVAGIIGANVAGFIP